MVRVWQVIVPDPGDIQRPLGVVPPVPKRRCRTRLPGSTPKPFAHPGTELCPPHPVSSCSRRSPRPPPCVGTRLAPVRLSWGCQGCTHTAPCSEHRVTPRRGGAPCVGLSRGWGTLRAVTPPPHSSTLVQGVLGSPEHPWVQHPGAWARGGAVGRHRCSRGAVGGTSCPPTSPPASGGAGGSHPGRFWLRFLPHSSVQGGVEPEPGVTQPWLPGLGMRWSPMWGHNPSPVPPRCLALVTLPRAKGLSFTPAQGPPACRGWQVNPRKPSQWRTAGPGL